MIRVWVTGAAGWSGTYLIRFLQGLSPAVEIVGLDRKPGTINSVQYETIDLTDREQLLALAKKLPPDRVIHLAGLLPSAPEPEMWLVNVGATQLLLQALATIKNPGLKIVSVGSAAEYFSSTSNLVETARAGGQSPYGRSKWAQGIVALASGEALEVDVRLARSFNLIGPGVSPQLVAGALAAQFVKSSSEPIRAGNTNSQRDFIDIRDAVEAYWAILEKGERGGVYNVSTGVATRIAELIEGFAAETGGGRKIQTDSSKLQTNDQDRVCGDNTRLKALGWSPRISLRQSIRDMLAAARSA